MKKAILGFLFTSSVLTSFLYAQRSGNPPTAADMVQRRVGMLTRQLSLTSAQQQQATTIFTNSATANTAAHEGLRTARQTLSDAVKSNNTAAIDQAATMIGSLTAQVTATDTKADAAFYQILTPDQQAKFTQARGQGFGGFGRGQGRGPREN